MNLPIDARYSIVETIKAKCVICLLEFYPDSIEYKCPRCHYSGCSEIMVIAARPDENGRLSYDEVNKFHPTNIDINGEFIFYNSEIFQILADYYQNDQYIPVLIITYLLNEINDVLPIRKSHRLVLKSLLSRDLVPIVYIEDSLKILNDISFVKEYFTTRPITLLDIKYIAYNVLYTKFLSDRKMLTPQICLKILLNNSPNQNLEVCKILLANLPYDGDQRYLILLRKMKKDDNYNYELVKYMEDKYNYVNPNPDPNPRTPILDNFKFEISSRYELYKSLNKYIVGAEDLVEILEITTKFETNKIFGYLCISESNYYMIGYYTDFTGVNMQSKKIKTLMEFLIFTKKFDLAFQLNELVPENNHRGGWYFYKKQIFDEYELYCQTYYRNQLKSANKVL